MKVGLIGYGRLGSFIAKHLVQDCELYIYDVINHEKEIKEIGAKVATLEQIAGCPYIIPFVPISQFESLIKTIAPLLRENTLVDVCSVKEFPVEVMKRELPSSVSILGTHPMFGPDSARLTLFGSKIVLCPIRINEKKFSDIENYLKAHGLYTITTTPEDHDKQIAQSLALTHFIGRGLVDFGASDLQIDTQGHRRLMKILETVVNDSWQLFEDMNHYNRYALNARENFIKALENIDLKLKDSFQ